MPYTVLIKRSAEKALDRLPDQIHDNIVKRLISLRHNPRPPGTKKLYGQEGYRIRAGDYRILYLIDEKEKKVEIVSVGHRREVYRQLVNCHCEEPFGRLRVDSATKQSDKRCHFSKSKISPLRQAQGRNDSTFLCFRYRENRFCHSEPCPEESEGAVRNLKRLLHSQRQHSGNSIATKLKKIETLTNIYNVFFSIVTAIFVILRHLQNRLNYRRQIVLVICIINKRGTNPLL